MAVEKCQSCSLFLGSLAPVLIPLVPSLLASFAENIWEMFQNVAPFFLSAEDGGRGGPRGDRDRTGTAGGRTAGMRAGRRQKIDKGEDRAEGRRAEGDEIACSSLLSLSSFSLSLS